MPQSSKKSPKKSPTKSSTKSPKKSPTKSSNSKKSSNPTKSSNTKKSPKKRAKSSSSRGANVAGKKSILRTKSYKKAMASPQNPSLGNVPVPAELLDQHTHVNQTRPPRDVGRDGQLPHDYYGRRKKEKNKKKKYINATPVHNRSSDGVATAFHSRLPGYPLGQ